MEMMKKAAEIADEMLSTMGWLLNRMSTATKLYDISDAKGLTAEVTVPIQYGKPGEVVVLLGHSLRNFQARSNEERTFPRGSKVLVADAGSNVLYVRATSAEAAKTDHPVKTEHTESESSESPNA